MAQRQGRGEPQFLSPQEWGEIRHITQEIMDLIPATARHERLAHEIGAVLARNVLAANQEYEETLVHKWEFGEHPISRCQPDWCGRYRGQRRDSRAV